MIIEPTKLRKFGERIEGEWRNNIAPFWLKHSPDDTYGGFRGWMSNDLRVDPQASKGIILNARILWTFSHAHRLYRDADFQRIAERAYAYLVDHFIDREFGGVYWTVDYRGNPLDTRKRPYAQAFALYGLTEFYLASGEQAALDRAREIYSLLEERCRDHQYDGYFETFDRDWQLAGDQRLSEVDQDEKKSMNTHLHVLEAYSALCRASSSAPVRERLRAIIGLFLNRIIQPDSFRLQMFFDETWAGKSGIRSFGHDIEASWLLCEAAESLGDPDLLAQVRAVALEMARSVYDKGLDVDGSLFYEADSRAITDDEKHWWTQTEGVVGFVNAFQLSGDEKYLAAAIRVWHFIDRVIIDRQNGEWFWKTTREGSAAQDLPKLSQWKCPYHNGRMCFEINHRLNELCVKDRLAEDGTTDEHR